MKDSLRNKYSGYHYAARFPTETSIDIVLVGKRLIGYTIIICALIIRV